ncbi:hypothetical protein [Methylocystis parvus]|uniref:Addiction module protein n=1 Tax=Methylocystis parvus TaxID=134 RepID=A0A6B8M813_9HYPH|nr:hypothetical protein [Methylocystis parvus]QGM98706.1 hypothetical protein F7D14_15275 [Methylocystis parvus]WBK00946.1 hypothetical protein MMG94_04290 [Methylocystis parvus OBBP]
MAAVPTSDQLSLIRSVTPSATPSEAEIEAWRELSRDEQLRRMRSALSSAEAATPCDASMKEIWAEIEAAASPRE